jgi:hypothetical protein
MKNTNIIRALTLILTIALTISALAMPALAAEAKPEIEEATTSNIEMVSKATAELHDEDAVVTEIDFIPLYNQRDYNIRYGTYGNVYSGGCGLVSLWMVATYLNDEIYDINDLAVQFGDYHVKDQGSLWSLFKDSAEVLGLDMIKSDNPNGEWYDWDMVVQALKNNQPVICLQISSGYFTSGGHFIVLTGITDDGKILVNDPNGFNWSKNHIMTEGFSNGFTEYQIRAGAMAFWIYDAKNVDETDADDIYRPVAFDRIDSVYNNVVSIKH